MSIYIRAGLIDTIGKYIPNEINKYIESKINRIIFPSEITHMIFRYTPKEMIKYLKNRDYYLTISDSKIILYIKEFDWKRLYYEIFKESIVKITHQYPKQHANIYLNALMNRRRRIWGHSSIFDDNYFEFKVIDYGNLLVKIGQGESIKKIKWTLIKIKNISDIAYNYECSIVMVMAVCGKIYVFGDNHFGQLGLGHTKKQNKFKEIKMDKKIIQIAMGSTYSIILSDEGGIFVTGDNRHGQLGLNDNKSRNKWEYIKLDEKIIQIACEYNHSLLLTDNGNVFGAGQNIDGQLGMEPIDFPSINKWFLIKLPEKIICVECTDTLSAALTISGKVYVAGRDLVGDPSFNIRFFTEAKWECVKVPFKITHITCKNNEIGIITYKGNHMKLCDLWDRRYKF